ncbi:MAG: hypothetical protein WDZ27_06890 [Waddliaceae bacterium]
MAAALIPINAIENNQTLNDLISIDQEGQITINNREEALRVLWTCDTNSIEYRAVQIAFQIMNSNEQNALKEKVEMGEREIKSLQEEKAKIIDQLDQYTLKQMKEDAAALSAAERNDGILDILVTPLHIVAPPMLVVKPIMGLCKILIPGSEAMRYRKAQLTAYQTLHKDSSLTDAYNYVKNNPLKYDIQDYTSLIEEFQENHPEGDYKEFVNYLGTKRLPVQCRWKVRFTDHGPTGFQIVRERE